MKYKKACKNYFSIQFLTKSLEMPAQASRVIQASARIVSRLWSFTTVCLLILLPATYFLTKPKTKSDQKIIIGTVSGYAPWVSINKEGNFEGFDIDLIQEIGKKLNKKIILQDLGSMTSLLMALDQKKVDAIIWGLSITNDRLEKIDMVHYQGENIDSFPLLFWQEIPENIKSIDDMVGKNICVEPTSVEEKVLDNYKFINKIYTEKIDDALLNIQYGKADAALVEPAIAKKFKNKFPQIKSIDIPTQGKMFGVGIGVLKTSSTLKKTLENTISELKNNGFIAELEKKWELE